MADEASNLDRQIEQLRMAVATGDKPAIDGQLASIEASLETLGNPLVRGFAYAEVRAALGEPAEAATVLEDLLAVIGDHPMAYYQLGCYRRQNAEPTSAIEAFTSAARLDPQHLGAWLGLGTLLDERGEPEAAIDAYRQALRTAPMDLDVWRNLGNSLAALARFDEAVSAYETALGQSPGDRTLVLLRAGAYQALGQIERANALTPEVLRAEVGTVLEVAHGDLRCRFRCIDAAAPNSVEAAKTLLQEAGADAGDVTDRRATGDEYFLVRRGSTILVCDPDPLRLGHPNRFFDASALVAGRRS